MRNRNEREFRNFDQAFERDRQMDMRMNPPGSGSWRDHGNPSYGPNYGGGQVMGGDQDWDRERGYSADMERQMSSRSFGDFDPNWSRQYPRDYLSRNMSVGSHGFMSNLGGMGNQGSYRAAGMNTDFGSRGMNPGGQMPSGWGGMSSPMHEANMQGYLRPVGEQEASNHPGYQRMGHFFGPFAGRGPKGYRRSDERIREDVCDRLTDHPEIDASDIEVEVRGCEVTVKGTTENRYMKRMIEDLIENVSGVTDVHNQIRVVGQTQGQNASLSQPVASGSSERNMRSKTSA